MNHPTLKKLTIQKASQAKDYVIWLVKNRLSYHFDDPPETIIWNGPKLSPDAEDIAELKRLHEELWLTCDPWRMMEIDGDLWKIYFDN